MVTTQLLVPEISCGHCERAITEALSPVIGVSSVSVNIPTRRVVVAYDPAQVDVERMSAVLAEQDYPVTAVEEAPETPTATLPMAATGCACGCAN